MDLKKPLTFDEQLDKLAAHGMIITDREKAKDILKRVNYIVLRVMLYNSDKTLQVVTILRELHLKRYIIYIKLMKYYVIHFDGILKKQKYIIEHRLHMDFQLLNVRRLRMNSIMMRIISITKRVIGKLWKISAGRKIIIKIV